MWEDESLHWSFVGVRLDSVEQICLVRLTYGGSAVTANAKDFNLCKEGVDSVSHVTEA